MYPYPSDWLQHGIVSVPLTPNIAGRFANELPRVVPGLDLCQASWDLAGQPPVAYGDLSDGIWSWRVVLDPQGLPPTLKQFVGSLRCSEGARQALGRLGLAALVFLVEGPGEADPLDELSALCCLMFGLLGLGGSAVLFPEGMRAFTPSELSFDPEQLSVADVGFFVGSEEAGETPDGERRWLRTIGMEQFRLPDLACTCGYGPGEPEELEGARLLFESMVRYLVGQRATLPMGDTLDLERRRWKVVPEDFFGPLPFSAPGSGVVVFERLV